MKGDLAGRVAVVTGSSRNIGRAIACELAGAGAAVVVNAPTSAAEAEAVADEIREAGRPPARPHARLPRPRAGPPPPPAGRRFFFPPPALPDNPPPPARAAIS